MVKSIEAVYRNGKIELLEPAPPVENARVIVTFMSGPGPVDLSERGIGEPEARYLRARLRSFEADWSDSAMDIYDAL
ncbi:MAG: hypothetical protein K1X53_14525 [Candidatus Sumerlaeaceae bacterium]|nr:hypothetical protein [Candidatus Sumerlaeaceae bacterium]